MTQSWKILQFTRCFSDCKLFDVDVMIDSSVFSHNVLVVLLSITFNQNFMLHKFFIDKWPAAGLKPSMKFPTN